MFGTRTTRPRCRGELQNLIAQTERAIYESEEAIEAYYREMPPALAYNYTQGAWELYKAQLRFLGALTGRSYLGSFP